MKKTYSPREFGSLIGKTTKTLQRWDRKGILKAHRSITERRYYTHDQYVQITGQKAKKRQLVTYCRVSSVGQKKGFDCTEKCCRIFLFGGRENHR